MRILAMALFALSSATALAQETAKLIPVSPIEGISNSDVLKLNQRYARLAGSLQQQSGRVLAHIERQESRLQKRLFAKDSAAASLLFEKSSNQYAALKNDLNSAVNLSKKNRLTTYIPTLDSLKSAFSFLQQQGQGGGAEDKLKQFSQANQQLATLEVRLQQATDIQNFILQRQGQLTAALGKYGLAGKVMALKKEAYYYIQELGDYKQALQDPDKLTDKALSVVRTLPAFHNFMQHNSYLSSLFRVPGQADTGSGKPIPGLQTRAAVAAVIERRTGKPFNIRSFIPASGNSDANASITAGQPGLQNTFEQGKALLGQWQDKIISAGGSNSDMVIPDFQPNSQHNQSFFHRLQVGFDLQSQQSTQLTPAISNVGFNIGYKLDDKHIIGVGGAYKLGLGHPFNHLALSSQGAAVRSFFNWKLKGSIWLTGGYEANYLNAFDNVQALVHLQSWQSSGLIGLLKTYRTGNRSGSMQILYDMLYKQHIPQSQPLLFRVGYSLR